jgi:hypothetical protein
MLGAIHINRRSAMAELLHPAATHHLPSFITPPGETDVLMVIMAFILIGAVMMFGLMFLRLHTLPERMAHKSKKIQFEIVAVLGLIALFTHMHIFWIAGLLLALIDLPDFGSSLGRIAESTEKMAGIERRDDIAEQPSETDDAGKAAAGAMPGKQKATKDGDGAASATKPGTPRGRKKELSHA